MKIPLRAGRERRLKLAVTEFERVVRRELNRPRGKLGAIYRALEDRGPLTSRQLLEPLGYSAADAKAWGHVAGALWALETRGYVRVAGFVGADSYRPLRLRKRGAKIFQAIPIEEVAGVMNRIERALRRLYSAAAAVEQNGKVASCIVNRALDQPLYDREIGILLRRADGESLKSIAAHYGITRERVRQIIVQAVRLRQLRERTRLT